MPPVVDPQSKAIADDLFEKAKGYTAVVLGVGYLGFFAAWSEMREHLTLAERAWSGLSMGVSLAAYISFEVVQMLLISVWALRKPTELFRARTRVVPRWLAWFWMFVVVIAIAGAVVGAFVLLRALARIATSSN